MFNRGILTMLVINFMGMFSYSIVLPLLPYYSATFNSTPLEIGFIFSIYSFFQFLAAPIMGTLSDAQGRRKWLIISLLGTALGFAFMAVANSILWLLLGRMIDGISGGNLTIAQAYISDNSEESERTRIYSYLTTTQGLGAIAGPSVAGYLAVNYSYQAAMWAATCIALVAVIIISLLLPESAKERNEEISLNSIIYNLRKMFQTKNLKITPELKFLYVVGGGCGLIFAGFFPTLTQYMQLQLDFSAQETGYMFTFFGIVLLVYQIFFSRILIKRFHDLQLIILGIVFLLIASILVGISWNKVTILICVIFYGMTLSTIRSPLTSLITQESEKGQKGAALGLLQSINSFSQIIAPIIIGWLMSYIALSAPGIVDTMIALTILIGVVFKVFFKGPRLLAK